MYETYNRPSILTQPLIPFFGLMPPLHMLSPMWLLLQDFILQLLWTVVAFCHKFLKNNDLNTNHMLIVNQSRQTCFDRYNTILVCNNLSRLRCHNLVMRVLRIRKPRIITSSKSTEGLGFRVHASPLHSIHFSTPWEFVVDWLASSTKWTNADSDMNIIASAFATQKTQNQCFIKQSYTLFSNVRQLFEFSKNHLFWFFFSFLNFKIREPSVSVFFSISKSENCQFQFFEKN